MKIKIFATLLLGFLITLPSAATVHTVEMDDNIFIPATLDINLGDTVVWVNVGSVIHTATSGVDCTPDGIFDSGNVSPDGDFMFVFETEGQFPYYCIPHCTVGMDGQINVSGTSPVDDVQSLVDLDVYPNPATDVLNIQIRDVVTSQFEILLFDQQGKTVAKKQYPAPHSEHVQMDISTLPGGSYILYLLEEGEVVATEKITRR